MTNQTGNTRKLEQLPEAARDRIDQLRHLFVERSKANLVQIRQLLDDRKTAADTHSVDTDLITLVHSLVGASGIFGYRQLGDAAFKVETTLRTANCNETEFSAVCDTLIDQLSRLD